MNRFHQTLFATGLLAAAGGANAAGRLSESERLEQLTVTGTREPRPRSELAESLTSVNLDALLTISPIHPSQALASVPGALISRGNGQESLIAIRSPVLTGAGSCGAFAITEEGIPLRGIGFCNVNQLFDGNFEQAQRIEVLRGPGGVLYGSDAQHGVINILSRPPTDGGESSLALEGGANDYARVSLGHSRGDSQGGYRISFNGARDGGFKENSGFDQQKMRLRHDGQWSGWSSRTLLSLSNLNQETAGYVTGKDAFKNADRKRENPNPEAFRDSQSARAQVRLEKSLPDGSSLQITPYARYTDMAFLMHFLPGTPLEENGQRGLGLRSAYRYAASETLDMTGGVDLEFTDAWLRQTQDGGFSVFPAGKQYDYRVNAVLTAGFAQAEKAITDATRVTLGGRIEHLRYDYDNRMRSGDTTDSGGLCVSSFTGAVGCRYTRPEDRRDNFTSVSINASLIHEFSADLNGSLRLAHGFRAPQASELYRLQNGQMRADLDPESIDSIELGLRRWDAPFRYSLTGFYMEKEDVVFQSSERLNLGGGGSRHFGLEYEVQWALSNQWELGFAGTFARHRYTHDVSAPGSGLIDSRGNDIDTAPHNLHNLRLNWRPYQTTQFTLQWQYTGSYYTDIENVHRYAGHDLLHLRLRQSLGEATSLGIRVENLANVDYAERADYSSLGGGDRYFIGEPRSLYADIRFVF
ncbi:TonB-dependent receptor [Microbulbifer mangrovi]|uniref:TonB-dependent receptor n=1 Tax=Microbulbifer mangrovi TaxID=927787 RepID=UPI00099036FE|nr:TonB-dependent receptor [Microbulbifer mangrovi]